MVRHFEQVAKSHQTNFRDTSPTISSKGRTPSNDKWCHNGHLLARCCEKENLYPKLRGRCGAQKFFKDREIKWWKGNFDSNSNAPTRSMVSSQVACVNFLLPLASIEGALAAVARAIDDDVQDIIDIDHEGNVSPVEFEWIGLGKSLEGRTGRGANNTSIDAFMVADTCTGRRAYLMEWKYTEKYKGGDYKGESDKGEVRWQRYAPLYCSESSSFGTTKGAVPMNELLYEPFYQIMRNRLLGDRMIKMKELDVSKAKVVVVVPEGNTAYRECITSSPLKKRFPDLKTVDKIMRATLKQPDASFKMVTPTRLLNAVDNECGIDVSEWAAYIRERYRW